MRHLAIAALFASLYGCVSNTTISHVARDNAVGTVHIYDNGKWQHVTAEDKQAELLAKCKELGATSYIITKQRVVYSGIISRGIELDADCITK